MSKVEKTIPITPEMIDKINPELRAKVEYFQESTLNWDCYPEHSEENCWCEPELIQDLSDDEGGQIWVHRESH